jgi:hypothetical protein
MLGRERTSVTALKLTLLSRQFLGGYFVSRVAVLRHQYSDVPMIKHVTVDTSPLHSFTQQRGFERYRLVVIYLAGVVRLCANLLFMRIDRHTFAVS